jgi:hypothetical protein
MAVEQLDRKDWMRIRHGLAGHLYQLRRDLRIATERKHHPMIPVIEKEIAEYQATWEKAKGWSER